jgi:hypothetical protein
MSDIHLVDDSPVVGARILSALVRRWPVYDYRVVEWTNERCSIDFYRHGERLEPTVTFTDDDARRAGLDLPRADGTPSKHADRPSQERVSQARPRPPRPWSTNAPARAATRASVGGPRGPRSTRPRAS